MVELVYKFDEKLLRMTLTSNSYGAEEQLQFTSRETELVALTFWVECPYLFFSNHIAQSKERVNCFTVDLKIRAVFVKESSSDSLYILLYRSGISTYYSRQAS